MRVALITTGKMELLALPGALRRLFPGHTFEAVEDVPRRPFPSFTSHRLPPPPTSYPPMVDKIVARAVSMVDPRILDQPDMVLVLDDLELENLDQPSVVVDVFRDAVRRHLEQYQPNHTLIAEMRSAITAKVSFHLAVPMIESWIFADPAGPTRAGVSTKRTIKVRQGDVEQFLAEDADYVAANEQGCPEWCKRRAKDDRPKWLGTGDRLKHPKGYLQWLTIDGSSKTCTSYSEVEGGKTALENIDWYELLRYRRRSAFARALVADISAALKQPPSIPDWTGLEAIETRLSANRPESTLRNL